MIIKILRTEGLMVFISALAIYFLLGFSWSVFLLLILVPDIFMAGYLKKNAAGAALYNIGHTYIAPFLLLVATYFFDIPHGYALALIWAAHIGIDRALGFGLKYASGFKDTHLGHIGR